MTQDRGSAPIPEHTGALHGLRVIDFGHYIAGPLAGMLLADQGGKTAGRSGSYPSGVCHLESRQAVRRDRFAYA